MAKPSSKILRPGEAARCPVLDPRTLGRPFHLLDDFCRRLHDALARFFELRLNRRYDAAFSVCTVAMQPEGEPPKTALWHSYRSAAGSLSVALERPLLLAALDYRYGGGSGAIDANAMETETEHRLAELLGRQLLDVLLACTDPGQAGEGEARPGALARVQRLPPAPGSQLIRVELLEAVRGVAGVLWLALDEAWLSHLFACITPRRSKPAERAEGTLPLAGQMQLTLSARLLQMELPLGALLDLQLGDVIPVRLAASADVLVDDARLFNAAVAEHNGKLWLTSFEDVE